MRTYFVIPVMAAALAFGSLPSQADVTLDVAVDVTTLAADVDVLRVHCHTCEGDCGDGLMGAPAAKQVDAGFAPHLFSPGQARTFKGTISVVARTIRPGNATHYLCYLSLHAERSGDTWEIPRPASNQPWGRPKAGTPINTTIKGKL